MYRWVDYKDFHDPSGMDILKMLSDLRQERDQIGEAIVVPTALRETPRTTSCLVTAVKGKTKRPGRPPGSKNKS